MSICTDEDDVDPSGAGPAFNELISAIQSRGVTNVAMYGFSHGGSSVDDSAGRLADARTAGTVGPYSLVFTAYIDAVDNEFFTPETDRPAATAWHLNIYQPNTTFELGGAHMPIADDNVDTETDPGFTRGLGHTTIDNDNTVLDYLRTQLLNRLMQR